MDITVILINAIKNKTPILFLKFGDGEYMCANKDYRYNTQYSTLVYKNFNYNNYNCDKDEYSIEKRDKLVEAFQYLVDKTPNCYIGLWHDLNYTYFWQNMVKNPIKFANYHSFFLDIKESVEDKVNLYKCIKYSQMKKIYICNSLLRKAKMLLNIDYMIHISLNNWFEKELTNVIHSIKLIIQNTNENFIIMVSGGITSKILIYELVKLFPSNIYLDLGSALDKICTKKTTRGWEPSYEKLMELLQEFLPIKWNNPEYNSIYKDAISMLGIHL